ncbi:MAG: right-handed parallel beta-helix repeat-containing protein [Syntrophobacteraceae bacterium]
MFIDHLTIQNWSGHPAPTIAAPTAADPAIFITGRAITINGFAGIGGGSSGILLSTGSATIINNTISGNTNSGIVVKRSASAAIGYVFENDTSYQPNIITDPTGIIVTNTSTAGIAGNEITASVPGRGNGIQVDEVSQATIAGNTINSFQNAIATEGNSGVNLSDNTNFLFGAYNTSTAANSVAVWCNNGAYANGAFGNLTGTKPTFFGTGCIDLLTLSSTPLVSKWSVTANSGFTGGNTPPTTISFFADGTETADVGDLASGTWTVSKSTLTVKTADGKTLKGSLTFSDSDMVVVWAFKEGKTNLSLTLGDPVTP